MATHILKCWSEHYYDVEKGKKKAELRHNDRNYKENDTLILRDYQHKTKSYNGHYCIAKITHVLKNNCLLKDNQVMLSIEVLESYWYQRILDKINKCECDKYDSCYDCRQENNYSQESEHCFCDYCPTKLQIKKGCKY